MRGAELKIEKLTKALSGLIGSDSLEELDAMEMAMRQLPAPDSDKAAMINAIDVLRDVIKEISHD